MYTSEKPARKFLFFKMSYLQLKVKVSKCFPLYKPFMLRRQTIFKVVKSDDPYFL